MSVLRIVLSTICLSMSWSANALSLRIPDGDVAALQQALNQAASSEHPVRIMLAVGGEYRLQRGLNLDAGNVTVVGGGARLVPASTASPSLASVAAGAELEFENLHIQGFPEGSTEVAIALPMTDVAGQLVFKATTLDNLVGALQSPSIAQPFNQVRTGGLVRFENATLHRVFAPCLQFGRGCHASYPVWSVAGEMEIDSSTLVGVSSFAAPGIVALEGGRIRVRNSVEHEDPSIRCDSGIVSEGGNLFSGSAGTADEDPCAGAQDRIVPVSPTVNPRPHPVRRGGLVPTINFDNDPARQQRIGRDCLGTDARGALRPAQGCTPGAFEVEGQHGDNRLLGGKGSVGVWYDPMNDGHYLQIQPLAAGEMLITWMHFDAEAQPDWTYSVTQANGNVLSGEAYRNRAVGQRDGVHGGVAERWGRFRVALQDCNTIRFDALPDTGSQPASSITLLRLTEAGELGCRE